MNSRLRATLAWTTCIVSLAFVALALPIGWPDMPWEALSLVVFAVAFSGFPVVGALIASRRTNVIGWLFLAIGLSFALSFFAEAYGRYSLITTPGSLPSPELAMWVGSWAWVVYLTLGVPLLLLLFPDGRPLSRRWLPVVWAVVAFSLLIAVASAFGPAEVSVADGKVTVQNPLQAPGAVGELLQAALGLRPLVLLSFLVAVVSVILRLRRSRGVERQQMKVFGYSAGFLGAAVVVLGTPDLFGGLPDPWADVTWAGLLLSLATLPVSVGVAILRYRLFDIDVLINRTLVYGALTAVVLATYFAVVVLFQSLLRPFTAGNELAVAVSTLATLALVQPLRRRIQDAVDHRFYRSRYDAARTLDAFSARLRDQVDLDAVRADLIGAVHGTVQPAHASVWLRERGQ